MAEPDDRTRREGVSPDARPRRQPPIIDVEAVEVSADGSRATTAGSAPGASPAGARRSLNRILTFLPPVKLAIIGSLGVVTAIIAGALWIYLTPAGIGRPERNAASTEAAVPDDVAKPETVLRAPPSEVSPQPPRRAGEVEVGDLESRMAALDATMASLGDRVAALERAVQDAAAAARVAAERADKAASQSMNPPPRPGDGREGGDEQNRAQERDRTALEDLAHRVAALESDQTALQQQQERLDRLASAATTLDEAIRVATVALALRGAVERNAPFTAELAAARSLGLDERALAALAPFAATGLPTLSELFGSLSPLVPELRRLSVPSGRDLGYLDRLQASAVKMLNIRPVRDEPGDDPATVMSRIEFKIPQQDIEAMVAELDKLPAPGKELAQQWRTKALARQEALESARLVATTSLAKLGEPAVRGPSPR
jgi:hypothetical protein